MPTQRRRLSAAEIETADRSELVRFCENLLRIHERDAFAFERAISDANRVLTKHDRGFVRGFFAACLEPIEAEK